MKKLFLFLAVAGVLTACQPEEIETAYEVNAATADVTVTVFNVNDGTTALVAGTDYNLSATVNNSLKYYVSGNVVTVEGNKAIPSGTVVTLTVTSTDNSWTAATQEVAITRQLAGGDKGKYAATFNVGELIVIPDPPQPEEPTHVVITTSASEATTTSSVYTFVADTGHSETEEYRHDWNGITVDTWYTNLTEFYLNVVVEYLDYSGTAVSNVTYADENYASVVDSYAAGYDQFDVENPFTDLYDCVVSAWAYYNVFQTVDLTTYTMSVIATTYNTETGEQVGEPVTVGSFSVDTYSTTLTKVEFGEPNGHGHYQEGHGHSHGGDMNAGGGIVYAE